MKMVKKLDGEISDWTAKLEGLPTQWQTSLEINNLQFERNGHDISFIASVSGEGKWDTVWSANGYWVGKRTG